MVMYRFWGGSVSEVKVYESGFVYSLQNKWRLFKINIAYTYKFIITGV